MMDHFRHPRHAVPLPFPDGTAWVRGQDTTRFVRIQVGLREGHVAEASFGTYGCVPAIACGSWVCEWAVGRSMAEVQHLAPTAVLEALGGLPPNRRDHADMTVQALQQAVVNAVNRISHAGLLSSQEHPV
ncbi:MAG TPA: iron-sulfur cluster assembly scaffold protein [Candidatus Xenobia bacterium]